MPETPAKFGLRMPGEWEAHEATWLSWPKDPDTFPAEVIDSVEKTYVKMITVLAQGEEVRILVDDDRAEKRALGMLEDSRNVTFHRVRTADVWVRDYAPIGVCGTEVAITKWKFNAWGEKYEDLMPDDGSGWEIARRMGEKVFEPGMVLEGGSIDVNGEGMLLTTEQCLLNPNRNPGLTRTDIEIRLKEYLGAERVVWLGSGIEGDDTDGHVDDIARFVNAHTVVAAWEEETSYPNHLVLKDNVRRLQEVSAESRDGLDIITIPLPRPLESSFGRLPASHLNFYIGNAAVLVPTFSSPTDADAIGSLQPFFPGRKVVGIDCRALVYGLGSIHCVTQQVPAPAREPKSTGKTLSSAGPQRKSPSRLDRNAARPSGS